MRRIFALTPTLIGIASLFLSANAFGFFQTPFDTSYRIDTIAGSAWVGDDGSATLAILTQPEGIAGDSLGNLYIADAATHRIRRVTRAGVITTFAGNGVPGFSGDGGPAGSAQLNAPYGICSDGTGNLYIADLGNARVRRIGADGIVTTVAGGGSLSPIPSNEGSPATLFALAAPRNVALYAGALYISDFGGHRVYRVDLGTGSMITVAGTGAAGASGDNGPARLAQLAFPTAIAFDRNGALFIADSQNHLIRKVANERISSFARAVTPTGLVIDNFGTLYVADAAAGQLLAFPENAPAMVFGVPVLDLAFGIDGYLYATELTTVVRVSFAGLSATIAGGGSLASGDRGPATNALLNHPSGVAADALGNLYIADRDNNRIRKVDPDGTITTIESQLSAPTSVTLDPNGNLYIADTGHHRVQKLTAAGVSFPVPFTGLLSPVRALADVAGNIYVSDAGLGAILKRTPLGEIVTLASHLASVGGFALDVNGNLYFAETGARRVRKLDTAGNLTTLADGIWISPVDVAVGANGDLFVVDSSLERVVHLNAAGSPAVVAGLGSAGFSGDGGDAAAAQLNSPSGLAIDPLGNIYIADLDNNRVRRLAAQPAGITAPLTLVSAVNAASLQPGPIAAGMLMSILGSGFSTADAPNLQVLFKTDTTQVFAATILSVNASGIEVRVPSDIAGSANVQIQILNKTVMVAQITTAVADASPGLFADSSGQALAVNENGILNSAANPIARGSILVLYGTGEGTSGQQVTVDIGGYAADVLYAGPVPGYPGLLQINVRVPSGYIGAGVMPVTIHSGNFASQPGVFVNLN